MFLLIYKLFDDIKIHMRIICANTFILTMYFNKMELFHHKHKCDKCGMEFKSKEELDEHMKMHMQEPEQPASAEQQPQQEAPVSQPQQPAQENIPEQPQDNGNTESQEQPQNQNEQQ